MPRSAEIHPLTKDRWKHRLTLFGSHGGYAGCWCMFWRLHRKDFKQLRGDGTREILHQLAVKNQEPGLLIYVAGKPAGWCSIGPRFGDTIDHAVLYQIRRMSCQSKNLKFNWM